MYMVSGVVMADETMRMHLMSPRLLMELLRRRKVGQEYKIYCGEISRSKVSILYDTWDDVPEGTKNTLWEDAKREFGIEEDVLKKRDVLTTCDKRWRDFKSRLVTRWITKTRKGPNNDRLPYVMYPFITREIWDQFVQKCSSKEFQAKSAKARISQAANKHPHFLGQKSYAEMIPIWQSRGYIPSATASSVDSSHISDFLLAGSDIALASREIEKR
ncbi:uncharacterized protein LOC125498651 [Beta vulgaris subsp. vulgaris]|uniref:uncharacterized protein LOC125498651 n=1 Tax=Beta vulgaris subsp. vulgaris TaxID=3555 RepID=UPI0025494081|nr:uncharacterized protein LOC125498651 [Beta vulgaris subsp. vulgaris]